MDASAWKRFYQLCSGQETSIGYIEAQYITPKLGGSFPYVVCIDHQVVAKSFEKHRLTAEHLAIIGEVLSHGEIRSDPKRSRHITLFFQSIESVQGHFVLGLKKCRNNASVRVTTFFKIRFPEFKRRRKKGKLLRAHVMTGTEVPVKSRGKDSNISPT